MITTAGDEMQVVCAVIASWMVGHEASISLAAKKSCDIRPQPVPHLYKKRKGGPAPNQPLLGRASGALLLLLRWPAAYVQQCTSLRD